MATHSSTIISGIMLDDKCQLTIETVADAILQSKIAEHAGTRSVCWDCDDLVFLDFDTLRVALNEVAASNDAPRFICLAVGLVPGHQRAHKIDTTLLAHGLVKQITQIVDANAILWHEDDRALNADVIDDFHEEIEKMLGHLSAQIGYANAAQTYQPTPSPVASALYKEDLANVLPKQKDALYDQASLDAFRDHLRAQGMVTENISIPLRISIYLMACSFFFVVPAIGTVLLSYAALRDGVDNAPSRA